MLNSPQAEAGARRAAGAARAASLVAVLVLCAAARLGYLTSSRANFIGDEAVTGIMVRRILHGDGFVFYAGQHYGGSLEVYLQALGYLVGLPANPLTLRLAHVALCVVATALVYLCARRALPTWGQAIVAAAFFAVGPWFNVLGGVTALGFYAVGVVLGLGALYCALRLPATRGSGAAGWALGFGLCAGAGVWNSLTSLYLILPALLWALARLVRDALAAALAAAGFVAGAAPAIADTLGAGRPPVPGASGPPVGLGQRIANLTGPVLREFLGLTHAHGTGGLPLWTQWTVVAAVAALYAGCLVRRRRHLAALLTLRVPRPAPGGPPRRDPVDLLLVAPVLIAALYVSSSMARYTGTPRYLFSAYPLLALSVAALLPHRRPVAWRVGYPLVLAVNAALCLSFFVAAPSPALTRRDAVLRQVADTLVRTHHTRVYADYQTGTVLQYLAGGRLDVAICGGVQRFPDSAARVAADRDPVYVDSPLAGSGLLTDPPDPLGEALTREHVSFRTTSIGFVSIHDPVSSGAAPPPACRVTPEAARRPG